MKRKPVALMRRFDGDAGWFPGQISLQRISGFFYGYVLSCPGCGERVYLDLNGREDWVDGDVEDVEALTLRVAVWHDTAACGWTGYVHNGMCIPMEID